MTMLVELNELDWLQSIWASLRRLEEKDVGTLPAPVVHVAAPDLAEIVTAVTSLKPGPRPEEIAAAITEVLGLRPERDPGISDAFAEILKALKLIDFRSKGTTYGGAAAIQLAPNQTIGISGSVEISNDVGNPIPVRQFGVNSATISRITSSATVVTLLTSNMSRNQATIYNESTQTLYVKFGSAASATDYTLPIAGSGYFEFPIRYLGIVTGVWASANGFAQVTEF